MKSLHHLVVFCGAVLAVALVSDSARGQAAPPRAGDAAVRTPAAPAANAAAPNPPFRKLAPGVVEDIYPDRKQSESFNVHDVVELMAVDNSFDWAKEVTFRHDVWTLDFKFKPLRMIWVDVPQRDGKMQRKLIWYMVYSVANPGKTMHPVEQPDGTYKVEYVDEPIQFTPVFSLEVHRRLDENSPEDVQFKKVYVDRLIPVALGPIRMREDRNRMFLNTTEISQHKIAVGKTVWGIVTWEDIDRRTKWFSIYVEGLTNAYRWKDVPGEFTRADLGKSSEIGKGRRLERKILKLNFWRPGDEYTQNEKQIRYGVPDRVDYEWIYR
jgi:hypothetical protein